MIAKEDHAAYSQLNIWSVRYDLKCYFYKLITVHPGGSVCIVYRPPHPPVTYADNTQKKGGASVLEEVERLFFMLLNAYICAHF